MSSLAIASIVFIWVFASAMLGLYLRGLLPDHHLSKDSLDVVKLATGLIATMAALVLGLLISSAKSSFDRVNDELVRNAARIVELDRTLGDYGPETAELRQSMKHDYTIIVELITSGDATKIAKLDTPESMRAIGRMQAKVWQLAPRDDAQRALRARALQITDDLGSTRALAILHKDGSIPMALLVVLASWLVIIFLAFGLFAPTNQTVIASLFICSLAAAGAILLILELDRPLEGLVRINGAPLRVALAHLGM